jgi:hypothetical protein
MRPRLFILGLALCPLIAASAERLNVKTGLWEVTTNTELGGMPPVPKEMLEGMTPEQLAQIKQTMAHAGSRDEVSRECITERDLDQPFRGTDQEDCTQEVVRTGRNTQELRLTCTGEVKGKGTFVINTPNPNTMTAALDLTLGDGENVMKMKATMKGRWLSADCGDLADEDDDE